MAKISQPKDEASFDTTTMEKKVPLKAIRVPARTTGNFMSTLKGHLFDMPKTKTVISTEAAGLHTNKDFRVVLLSKEVSDKATLADPLAGLPEDLRAWVRGQDAIEMITHIVTLGYEHLTVDEALRHIIPSEVSEIPSGFETAGHVAHLNLREEVLPYKHIIAKVIMDKNSRVKTVVNKTANIATEFRTFPMELLAGDPNLVVELREHGCSFTFDFEKVYWNSRLQHEHDRLQRLITSHHWDSGEERAPVVADIMGGVGPFACPLALHGATVFANDLNPESFKWLNVNAKKNKVQDRLHTHNMDGREFVHMLRGLTKNCTHPIVDFDHAIMNLPQTAINFLDAFRGYHRVKADSKLPMIHVHCFEKGHETEEEAAQSAITRASVALAYPLLRANVEVHFVRLVAPKKPMMCLSFRLPAEVARAQPIDRSEYDQEPQAKKRRIEEDE